MSEQLSLDEDFDPDDRVLCPDEACIGILDASGRCKECGAQGSSELGAKRPADDSTADLPGEEDEAAAAAVSSSLSSADSPAADADDDDFADRQLCSDPLCIGVLDTAGRCKECGRSSSLAAS